jgi:Zn-dependent protease with chaperone function
MGSGRLRLATITVLAAVWAVASYFLWTTTRVPDGLHLSGLPEREFFPSGLIQRAEHYESFFYWLVLGQTVATVLVFCLYAWRGARFTRESAAGPIGTGMLLAMLGFGLVWLVTVPFEVLALWWQRRYDQSHQSYADVIFGGWFLLTFEFLLLCAAVVIAMGFARLMPRLWWLPAAGVFVALQVLLLYTSPYLIPDTHPLRDPELKAAAARIAEKEGVKKIPIRVVQVDTKDPNAFATGLGPSRKVFILSSMLDGRFTERQLEAVVAHEYGHQARNHLPKAIAWYALFTIPLAYLIAVVARRRGGMERPEAIPLVLLVFVVFGLVTRPLHAAITRHMEAEADWVALETTRNPQAMQSLFQRFARTGLSDPSPPTASYLVFYDHPTFVQRIAMARAWARREGLPEPPAGS